MDDQPFQRATLNQDAEATAREPKVESQPAPNPAEQSFTSDEEQFDVEERSFVLGYN